MRIEDLVEQPGEHVLVCTDCLSEGINLQTHFNAVLHYDLAWNPTRHEQREGRVDRFGQESPEVRVVTWYGADNPVDGVILDVLLRKHKSIKNDLGVTVSVPGSSEQIAETLFEGALFRERAGAMQQMSLDFIDELESKKRAIHEEWENARERERASRSRYAQHALKPEAVAAELESVRSAIGRGADVEGFVRAVLQAAKVPTETKNGSVKVHLADGTPRALRQAIGRDEPFAGRFDLPLEDGELYLGRTSPVVEGLAGWTLDQALDRETERSVAARCGVISTSAVDTRTTLLLVRFRHHLANATAETRLVRRDRPAGLHRFSRRSRLADGRGKRKAARGGAARGESRQDRDRSANLPAAVPVSAIRAGAGSRRSRARRQPEGCACARSRVVDRKMASRAGAAGRHSRRLRSTAAPAMTRSESVRSEGGLLPPDLLRRVIDGDAPGLRAEDYGLPRGDRFGESITPAWNRLLRHWSEFRAASEDLAATEAGTAITNDRWTLPLLRELGFGPLPTSAGPKIAGRTYSINRFLGPVPVHLVGCNVNLDRRSPGVRGAARVNPHGLTQEFLNRSDEHLWAVVSNGLQLRLLRDSYALSRQSFLEFDLEAMFAGELYPDFVQLWLTAHATRFAPREGGRPETCWLEIWMKEAEERGARALGDLQGGVERALRALGRGFTNHPKNVRLRDALRSGELELTDLHGQLLRIVYRLIFLFVAEDRTLDGRPLIHPPDHSDAAAAIRERYAAHYGTARLRSLAGSIKGSRHGDLWRQFRLVADALSGDEKSEAARLHLALPALGGFLWKPSSTAAFNDAELANVDFLDVLRHLAFFRQDGSQRPVDYRNLGAEELGGVYESLLALTSQDRGRWRDFRIRGIRR